MLTGKITRHLLPLLLSLLPLALNASTLHPPYSQGYDPARNPFIDGRAALKLAQETKRRVLIEVGGNWCSWCLQLDKFLAENHQLREQLHRHFVILKVNVSESNDNAEFMAGFPKPLGYPHIYIAEVDGRIIFSKDTAQLLENSRYSVQRFQQFIDKWKLP
jgi:thioredoxin-related protein